MTLPVFHCGSQRLLRAALFNRPDGLQGAGRYGVSCANPYTPCWLFKRERLPFSCRCFDLFLYRPNRFCRTIQHSG